MYELTTARGYPPSLQREGTAGMVEKVKWLRGTYGEEVKTQTPKRETEMSRSHEEKPYLWKEGCQRMPQKGTERRTHQRPHFRQQEGDHDISFHSTIGEELGCKGVCCFLGPHLQHMEVPRLGVESELQLLPTPQKYPAAKPGIELASSWILVRFVTR